MRNLTTDIQLGIELLNGNGNSPENDSVFDHENKFFIKSGNIKYHKIEVNRERTSYLITMESSGSFDVLVKYDSKPTTNDFDVNFTVPDYSSGSFDVLVKYDSKPTTNDFDVNFTVPDYSSCTRNFRIDGDDEEYNCSRHPNQLLLTNAVIQKPGVYFVGILYTQHSSPGSNSHRMRRSCFSTNRQKRSCVETKDPPPPLGVLSAYDPRVGVNYTLVSDELSCRFWSHKEQNWLTEGCKVCCLNLFQIKRLAV